MTTLDRTRYPREWALDVAKEIYDLLKPWCERCKVVGSLRRRKRHVGDIEILFIGKKLTQRKDLFENEEYDAALFRIDELEKTQVIRKRPNVNGVTMWGPKNRLAFHVESEIPVDFFATTEEAWFNYLVCRTGGQKNNTLIAEAYRRKGYRWAPYEAGFYGPGGVLHENRSEEDVYRNAGLKYLAPEDRP